MNTQLVNSIVQVVQALPTDEQTALLAVLNRLIQPSVTPQVAGPSPATAESNDEAWAIWESLGDDAVPGTLDNASVYHDRYLYTGEQ